VVKSLRLDKLESMVVQDPAVNWLLESGDPSICYLTLTEIL